MQKHLRHLPLMLCILYGFYPLMQRLGYYMKFGYELRSPTLSITLTAVFSISAMVLLLWKKPAQSRIGYAALDWIYPLACIHALSIVSELRRFGLVMVLLCCFASAVIFFAQAKQRWRKRAIGLITSFLMLLSIPAILMFAWFNPIPERTKTIASYSFEGRIRTQYCVDEGALGEDWFVETRSTEAYDLIFGTFYPYYEIESM